MMTLRLKENNYELSGFVLIKKKKNIVAIPWGSVGFFLMGMPICWFKIINLVPLTNVFS